MIRDIQIPPGGVVLGVGIDLVEVARIQRVYERHPQRFLDRVFTEGEQAYCMAMKNPFPHLAARFAAKEALSKAFTTGIGGEFGWKSLDVTKGTRGEPIAVLDETAQALLKHLGATNVLITLAHTENYGQAVALLVRAP